MLAVKIAQSVKLIEQSIRLLDFEKLSGLPPYLRRSLLLRNV